jgi:4-amino-4-deoxy-L-arabinose transferase-like glycosyltransferase
MRGGDAARVNSSAETSVRGAMPSSATPLAVPALPRWRAGARTLAARLPRPELLALLVLAALLNLWALGQNGWANTYYSAAVRSMSQSWHNFLFASLDPSGVMTVDKPPLSLWVQSLSVRVFGYHPLSVLVPQALMGLASVALTYDLVRRRFGRAGGFIAGLALALTPIMVAVSRHNNPDALLVLCSVAAVWCAVRALDEGGARWLVMAGVCAGLGFETKMGVALVVVPGIAAAWLLIAPHGRRRALRQLLAAGGALALLGGAWAALVELTPAASRPWISGTSDNGALSLIFGYNGLGRVDGQTGGPGGGGGSLFGGLPGPFRLLNAAMGGQAGWLLGFAVLAALGILAASRLRRSDPRTGWLVAVGGAFITTAVLFSAASGISHPYYVALLAPFTAALVGAGAAQLMQRALNVRIVGPLALAGGVVSELVVLGDYPGQLRWLEPVVIVLVALAALALVLRGSSRVRIVAVSTAIAALLIAPSVWAIDTLGHAASGTFPAGGPTSVSEASPTGMPGRAFARPMRAGGAPPSGFSGTRPAGPAGAPAGGGPPASFAGAGAPRGLAGGSASARFRAAGAGRAFGAAGAGPFGADSWLTEVVSYVKVHGGGTIAVSSQSSAASAIIGQGASVAGIGGFSGRESEVSVAWLAQEVSSGRIRWVLSDGPGAGGPRLRGDTRTGAKTAFAAVARACKAVSLPSSAGGSSAGTSSATLYDCLGRAAALSA